MTHFKRPALVAVFLCAIVTSTVAGQTNVVDIDSPWAGPMTASADRFQGTLDVARNIDPENFSRVESALSALAGTDFSNAEKLRQAGPLVQILRGWGYDAKTFGALEASEQRNTFVRAVFAVERQADKEISANIEAAKNETDGKRLSESVEELRHIRLKYDRFVTPENVDKVNLAVVTAHERAINMIKANTQHFIEALMSGADLPAEVQNSPVPESREHESGPNNLLHFPRKRNALGSGLGRSSHAQMTADDCVELGNTLETGFNALPEEDRWQPSAAYSQDVEAAFQEYNRALELNPHHAGAYIGRGLIHVYRGDKNLAEADFVEAIRIDPTHPVAYVHLAGLLDREWRLSEAGVLYDKAIALGSGESSVYYNAASVHYRNNQPWKALEYWRKYIQLDRAGEWNEKAKGHIEAILKEYGKPAAIGLDDPKETSAGVDPKSPRAKSRLELVHNKDPRAS